MQSSTSVSSVGLNVLCNLSSVPCLYFECFESKVWALIAAWAHAQYFTICVPKLCVLLVLPFSSFCDVYRIWKVCLVEMWECLIWLILWLIWLDSISEYGSAGENTIYVLSFRCVRDPCACLFLFRCCLLVGRAGSMSCGLQNTSI